MKLVVGRFQNFYGMEVDCPGIKDSEPLGCRSLNKDHQEKPGTLEHRIEVEVSIILF
jgi:hypothetical protein